MTVLVTGGGGFLGKAIVRRLLDRGQAVRSLSRNHYPCLEKWGVQQVQGDMANAEIVLQAAAGCDMVFHVAAKPGVWGSYSSYHAANVIGTENVLAACRKNHIRRLVYTSSPSVVFDGADQDGVDESVPYPDSFLAHYPATKAEAEHKVLTANGQDLAVVSLRPHLIWGPGDNHLVPRILAQGRAGKLALIGGGRHLVDSVYIDNAAEAHLLAADRLEPGATIAGNSYFISNDEPVIMAELINGILAAGGVAPVTRSVSPTLAYIAGGVMEGFFKILRLDGEPRMTRFVARQLATAHWFNIGAAKRDLGYRPLVSNREGFALLQAALNDSKSRQKEGVS